MLPSITVLLLDMRKLGEQFNRGVSTSVTLVDPESDAVFGNGRFGLTWRRSGQELPAGVSAAWTVHDIRDSHMVISRIIGDIVATHLFLDDIDVIESVVELFDTVNAVRSVNGAWQYQHSAEYYELVNETQFGQNDPFARFEEIGQDTPARLLYAL